MRNLWVFLAIWSCGCALSHHAIDAAPPDRATAEAGDTADAADATDVTEVADGADAADTVDVSSDAEDVMDATEVGPDAEDATDAAPDAEDVQPDVAPDVTPDASTERTITVRIQFVHDTIGMTGDYYVHLINPDGTIVGWTRGHCVGGVRSLGDPRNTDECQLDIMRFTSGEIVDVYPIYASDSNPICSCDSGGACPSGYPSRFLVLLDSTALIIGSGLSFVCLPAAVGGNASSTRFTIP